MPDGDTQNSRPDDGSGGEPGASELEVTRQDGVLRLTINSPGQLNALSTPVVDAMADEISTAAGIRAAVIRGAGRAFSSGARLSDGGPNVGILDAAMRLITSMSAAPYPIVAAVHGPAVGLGCSIALAADLTVASDSSYFLQAFVRVGLMPDGGATELLSASIGRARALWLAMSGEKVPARDALAMGLIGCSVPDDDFEVTVENLVGRLANGPTLALARMKAGINLASMPGLARALEFERAAQAALLLSQDYLEGKAAFTAKRSATFGGH